MNEGLPRREPAAETGENLEHNLLSLLKALEQLKAKDAVRASEFKGKLSSQLRLLETEVTKVLNGIEMAEEDSESLEDARQRLHVLIDQAAKQIGMRDSEVAKVKANLDRGLAYNNDGMRTRNGRPMTPKEGLLYGAIMGLSEKLIEGKNHIPDDYRAEALVKVIAEYDLSGKFEPIWPKIRGRETVDMDLHFPCEHIHDVIQGEQILGVVRPGLMREGEVLARALVRRV